MNPQTITPEVWIQIAQLLVDLLKTAIPFGVILLIFCLIRDEVKFLLRNRGLKLTVPGGSFETYLDQKDEVTEEEKAKVVTINNSLKSSETTTVSVKKPKNSLVKDDAFLFYHFEKTYRLLFPSQIMILNIMINSNGQMQDFVARAHFRRTIWAIQFNSSYDDFMNFLIQSGLILYESENKVFTLAPLGKLFWNYLKDEKIPLKNFKDDIVQL